MDRTLLPATLLLLAIFGVFEISGIDLWLQDRFYNFTTHAWLVDQNAPSPRLLFYTGPKTLIWVLGACLIGLALSPAHWRARLPLRRVSKRDLWITIAAMAAAPLLIATGKATTNIFTPKEIRRYGGSVPYVKVCEAYPPDDRPAKRGRGFPAGHASGGFALMALAGLARTRRTRGLCIAAGLTIGGIMGIYQMLKGAHYLSHTVISALACWIVFLLIRRCFRVLGLPSKIRRVDILST